MTTPNRPALDSHASDADLLAIHDQEPVSGPLRAHVDGCAECQARLATLSDDVMRVRSAIADLPTPPLDVAALRRTLDDRRRAPRSIESRRRPAVPPIVAALALASVAAASVRPIRTMFAGRQSSARSTNVVATPIPAPPADRVGSTISFAVTAPEFTVRFDSTPAQGQLDIDRSATPDVSAQSFAPAGGSADAMVVLPHELHLRNTGTSTATYRVMIPSSVERLRVIVGGRTRFDGAPRPAKIVLSSSGTPQ